MPSCFLLQRIAPDPLFMTTFGRNIRTTCCQLLAGLSTIVAPFRSIASWCVEECATPTVSPWRRHAVNQVVLIQSLSPFSAIQTYVDKERFPWCYLTLVHVPLVMHDCICVPFVFVVLLLLLTLSVFIISWTCAIVACESHQILFSYGQLYSCYCFPLHRSLFPCLLPLQIVP